MLLRLCTLEHKQYALFYSSQRSVLLSMLAKTMRLPEEQLEGSKPTRAWQGKYICLMSILEVRARGHLFINTCIDGVGSFTAPRRSHRQSYPHTKSELLAARSS